MVLSMEAADATKPTLAFAPKTFVMDVSDKRLSILTKFLWSVVPLSSAMFPSQLVEIVPKKMILAPFELLKGLADRADLVLTE